MTRKEELESLVRAAWENQPKDLEILGAGIYPGDENSPTLANKVTYAWYRAIATVMQPERVGEIGVRYGYSIIALQYEPDVLAYGWDNQSYGQQSNSVAAKYLQHLYNENTNTLTELEESEFDIFSVDGDHSEAGSYHDMELAWRATSPGGLLLVDDVTETGLPEVRKAFDRFVADKEFFILPTYRGLGVIVKEE